ncbi:MAG: hypothetical protein Q9225_003010 [Loekoesia sp. 1 TL-2023]
MVRPSDRSLDRLVSQLEKILKIRGRLADDAETNGAYGPAWINNLFYFKLVALKEANAHLAEFNSDIDIAIATQKTVLDDEAMAGDTVGFDFSSSAPVEPFMSGALPDPTPKFASKEQHQSSTAKTKSKNKSFEIQAYGSKAINSSGAKEALFLLWNEEEHAYHCWQGNDNLATIFPALKLVPADISTMLRSTTGTRILIESLTKDRAKMSLFIQMKTAKDLDTLTNHLMQEATANITRQYLCNNDIDKLVADYL